MTLTLPEEVLLLLLHDEKGTPMVDGTAVGAALAGAALVELTMDGALRLTEIDEPDVKRGRLVATGRTPADPRLAALVEPVQRRKPKDAITKLTGYGWGSGAGKGLREGLLHGLADQGLLSQEKGRVLGLFPTTSWPQGYRREAEVELVDRVRRAVVAGERPDRRTSAVVSILNAVGALPKLFPDQDKKALKKRGRQISDSDWAGPAVRKAVEEAQAAMVAVLVTTTTVATTST